MISRLGLPPRVVYMPSITHACGLVGICGESLAGLWGSLAGLSGLLRACGSLLRALAKPSGTLLFL